MAKTFEYAIFRKGSNASNQPMCFDWVPIYVIEAHNKEEAVKLALEAGVSCYNNQILEARSKSKVSKSNWNEAILAKDSLDKEIEMECMWLNHLKEQSDEWERTHLLCDHEEGEYYQEIYESTIRGF